MVLDFGLNTSMTSFNISNHNLRAVKKAGRKKKTRHASYKDYEGYSSDDCGDGDDYNNHNHNHNSDNFGKSNAVWNTTATATATAPSPASESRSVGIERTHKKNSRRMASYAAVLAAHEKIVYAADVENGQQQQQQQLQQQQQQLQQQQQQQQQQQEAAAASNEEERDEDEHFLDSLDEVHTRFILNVPQEELSTSERIFFQLEQAWWYYEDLICDKIESETGSCSLPRFANLKPFSKRLFEFSPLLRHLDFHKLWKEFSIYKRKISTYGCILLNAECTHVAMCKMYKSNVWTFPAGKINQNEIGIDAAARECYEETGFDPHCLLGGLTKEWLVTGETQQITWNRPLRDPDDALTFVEQPSGKRRTCYVCCGVPEDFPFEPVCRKEIDTIEWIDLRDIKEYKSFAVLPFVGKLKKWIKRRNSNSSSSNNNNNNSNKGKKKKERKNNKSRPKSRPKSSGRDASTQKGRNGNSHTSKEKTSALVEAGLIASVGDATRWTEQEMFDVNSKLQGGRIVEYDGNPHAFAEKGFGVDDEVTGSQRVDPHSFRVVGGSFMNSEYGDKLAEASDPKHMAKKYQPLVREMDDDNNGGGGDGDVGSGKLQPFFSHGGATPWGAVVDEAKSDPGDMDLLLQDDEYEYDGCVAEEKNTRKSKSKKKMKQQVKETVAPVSGDYDYDDDSNMMMIFATDKEITAKKQRDYELEKQQYQSTGEGGALSSASKSKSGGSRTEARRRKKEQMLTKYEADMAFVHDYIARMPNPVGFEIENVDDIIEQHYGKHAASKAAAAAAAVGSIRSKIHGSKKKITNM